jgi:RNA polymerase sigma-70 factor (family 1)
MQPCQKKTQQKNIFLFKKRDKYAFTAIYDRYWGILYRHARKILFNDDEVHDIIQDIFLNLWMKGPSLELDSSLSAYLYASVRNRILNHLDRRKSKDKYVLSLGIFLNKGEYTTDIKIRENELAVIIEKEVAALPEKMREVFELSRKSNLSYKEIGLQTGLADSTVKNQISKAIKILKLKLGELLILCLFLHR